MLFSSVMKIYLDLSETLKLFHSLAKWKFEKKKKKVHVSQIWNEAGMG